MVHVPFFLKLALLGRVAFDRIGAIKVAGTQLFISDHQGELVAVWKFETEEETEKTYRDAETQLDAWEEAKKKQAAEERRAH